MSDSDVWENTTIQVNTDRVNSTSWNITYEYYMFDENASKLFTVAIRQRRSFQQ